MSDSTVLQTTSGANIGVDPFRLVFHVDILLLAVAAVFALATLPRAFARFSRGVEWRYGHVLRSLRLQNRHLRRAPLASTQYNPTKIPHSPTKVSRSPTKASRSPTKVSHSPTKIPPTAYIEEPYAATSTGHDGITSEESHTYVSHTHLIRRPSTGKSAASMLPPHVRAWSSVLPPVGNLFRYRLDSGFSAGQALLNYIHRYAGLMLIVLSNIHGAGYIYEWALQGKLAQYIQEPANKWALVALVAIDTLYVFSNSFWRRKAYNIFFGTHVICFIIFIPAVYAHQARVLPYICAASAAYGLDHVFRLLKTRLFYARIRPIPDLMSTRVEIPQLNAGWRPGQHVRIRVLSSAMGWIGWAEAHPFTIASVGKTPEGFVLICKKAGGWTGKLYEMAKVAGYGCESGGMSRSVLVMVEGPYGGPGHSIFASYSAAMFVVGGSGITFALSAIQDLIQRDLRGSSRVKIIELLWSVQDPSSLTPLLPQFAALVQQSVHTPLHISVHYTRAADTLPSKEYLPPGITLTAGRPRIGKVLDAVLQRTVSYGSGVKASMDITGVIVGVCGPVGLGDEVAQVVSSVDPGRRWAVGGIEMHEE
ncbi:hypothetical protein ID866_9013 [Astraeus odoratus]|nr:hypothetical protein ID866_9013 [Astraeus odoratus]